MVLLNGLDGSCQSISTLQGASSFATHWREPKSLLGLVCTNVPKHFRNSARVLSPIDFSDHLPVIIQSKTFQLTKYTKLYQMEVWPQSARSGIITDAQFLFDDWTDVFILTVMWCGENGKINFPQRSNNLFLVRSRNGSRNKCHHLGWTRTFVALCGLRTGFKRAQLPESLDHWKEYCTARSKGYPSGENCQASSTSHANRLEDPTGSLSKWWQVANVMCGLKLRGTLCKTSHRLDDPSPSPADWFVRTSWKPTFSTTLSSILTRPFLQTYSHWSCRTSKCFWIPSHIGRGSEKSDSFIAQ